MIIDEARCNKIRLGTATTKAGSSCLTLASTPFDDSAAAGARDGGT
jgi:hypothetical protein